ncbi:MAG: DUF2491 family protein [Verrucomicrobia bacterium]|nr:MAG: DUF2491 family protein [Verrucomicrobiota bacterium]
MTIWELIKAKREKSRQEKFTALQMANPLDRDLPFGLHLDGKIEIATLLPEVMKPLLAQGAHVVAGFSEVTIMGQQCFRVLIIPEQGDTGSYLLICPMEEETLVRWFVNIDEVFPSSSEEWDFWLSDEDGSIGIQQFQSKDGELFDRLWGAPEECFVEPVCFDERLVLNRFDDAETKSIEHRTMLYGRAVADEVWPCDQYVLLSACTERDGSYVSIDAGVDLDFHVNVKVIY